MDTDGDNTRNACLLFYCDKCSRLIKPVSDEGIKDGDRRLCAECAPAPSPARGSQRNLEPATPHAAGMRPTSRDSRRLPGFKPPEFLSNLKRTQPKPALAAAGIGLVLLLTLVLWLVMGRSAPEPVSVANGPSDPGAGPSIPRVPPASPVHQPPSSPPAASPVQPPPDPVQPPLDSQPGQPAMPAGPTSEERLATFTEKMQSVAGFIAEERYKAASDLLGRLKDESAEMPWWKDQESRLNEAREKLQQLIQEGREESEDACAEAEKAETLSAIEAIEREWRPKRTAAPAGEWSAEWAQNVLDAVEANRRGQRKRLFEQRVTQLDEKLGPFEKSLQNAARFSDAQQKDLLELERLVLQDRTLIDRFGERLASLRWVANAFTEDELMVYGATLRKSGGPFEVAFDFSSREQMREWEFDDPEKHGRWELVGDQGLRLATNHQHEWSGKDRRNTPVLRIPFWLRAEAWVVEADVELHSRTTDKPYGAGLTVWDGGQNHLAVVVEETGKGWSVVLWGCTPQREAVNIRAGTPLPAKAGESVRLQMACAGDTVTVTARFRGATSAVGRERMGFQPKYLGLMVRTHGDMKAMGQFRDLKMIGLPDSGLIKAQREHRKPAEVKKLVEDLRLRGLLTERIVAGDSFPVPLGDVANIACGSRLRENRRDDERLLLPRWGLLALGDIPFQVTDPLGGKAKNAILLKGEGAVPSRMPKSVVLPCGRSAAAIHLLSGVSVGGFPGGQKDSHTMTLRIVYQDGGEPEEYEFRNGQHFADFARVVDVPDSRRAFVYQGRQVRCISLAPKRPEAVIKELEFVKGSDGCAPLVLGVTLDRLPIEPAQAKTPNPPPGGVISINFTNTGDTTNGVLEPGTAAGVVSRTNWNNYAYNVSTYGLNPKDDTGTTLASTYVNYRVNTGFQGNYNYGSTVGNDYLMRYFCGNDEGAVYTQRTLIRVSGLPASFMAAGYSIYVYSDFNNNSVLHKFDLGTSALEASNSNAGMTVLSTATIVDSTDWLGTGNPTGIFTEGADGAVGNYLVFRNQTASEFAIFPYAAGPARTAINGIQIVANGRFRAAASPSPREK